MDLIISSVVGAIAGLIIGILFEEPLTAAKKRLIQKFRTLTYHRRSAANQPDTLALGGTKTSWLVIDGDGELSYSPETITCRVENTPASLPPEIKHQYDRIENRERENKENGLNYLWNGPLYSLERFVIGRTIPDECLEVVFTFRPTDYFTFQATVMRLDEPIYGSFGNLTLRQKYLSGPDLSQPVAFLANGFGIALVVFTSDKKIILTRRPSSAGTRAGELDASVVEGVHPILDRSTTQHSPDLYRTAIRGAQEELGVELIQDEIVFLGFGVDMEYYQWNMLGIAHASRPAGEILESRKRGTPGKWELKELIFLDCTPRSVFSFLKDKKIWSTGKAAIYWALVHELGRKRVEAAIDEIQSHKVP